MQSRVSQPEGSPVHYRNMTRLCILFAALLALGACATPATRPEAVGDPATQAEIKIQKSLVLENYLEHQERLEGIAYRLATRGAPLCRINQQPSLGLLVVNQDSFGKSLAEAAAAKGFTRQLTVLEVFDGSPAARAGIQPGDTLLALGAWAIPDSDAEKAFYRHQRGLKTDAPLLVTYLRAGIRKRASLIPVPSCGYDISFTNSNAVNAYADGKRILVTRGMLRFVKNDNELALVIAHEMAHNGMGHIAAQRRNQMLGLVADIVASSFGIYSPGVFTSIGAHAFSKKFEAEADYVGLYLMAQAGYRIDKAPYFWRRMAAVNPGGIQDNLNASHPASAYRFLALEKAVAEIKRKEAEKLPLRPEMR